ncbi:MAG: insulinase family protein [Clostridium sp.]|nr:insulinase family protein [Clostridium sp.]
MEYILKNGIKLIYRPGINNLTSISIGLEAGAFSEGEQYGLAHAVEHMVYKGTKSKTEDDINKKLSSIFGFQNAMTNYPYVIYYGTLLDEDFEQGVELFSDILINPALDEAGFYEEMEIIKQELNEWDADLEQFAEDKLFYNTFNNRLKHPIIGTYDALNKITLGDIKEFYKKNYIPSNACIVVVSKLSFNVIKNIIEKYFLKWDNNKKYEALNENNELLNNQINYVRRDGINVSRVQMIFSLSQINEEELDNFKVFNEYFGEGVNSLLFNELRTKMAIVYDVLTEISYEKGIRLYKINFTTASKENAKKALKRVIELIKDINQNKYIFDEDMIKSLAKIKKLKELLYQEKSINIAKKLSTEAVMNIKFSQKEKYEDVLKVAKKVLSNYSAIIVY